MTDLTLWHAILLGLLQGVAEWLPISSSGHLVLAERLLGVHAPPLFDLALHLGTLVVVLVFFRRRVAGMLVALARVGATRRAAGSWSETLVLDADLRLAAMLAVGTVPTAVIGLLLADAVASSSVAAVGAGLMVTGAVLWSTRRAPPPREAWAIGWRDALLVGAAQGVAALPGISRSGSTISMGLHSRLERETAVTFSFLLSVPAILGALAVEWLRAPPDAAALPVAPLVAGVAAAALAGFASLSLLVRIIRGGGFHRFAFYCWAVGAAALAWGVAGGA